MNTLALLFGLILSLVASPAHAKDMALDYRVDINPVAATGKKVKIEFVDERGEWAGTQRLGHVRAGAGIPYSLHNDGIPIESFFTQWLTDSLQGAGYTVDGTADETARLTLEYFWIEGYMVYDVHLKMKVDLVSSRGLLATQSYDRRLEERLDWTVNELNKPINALLQQIGEELVGASYAWDFKAKPLPVETVVEAMPQPEADPEALVLEEPIVSEGELPSETAELPDGDDGDSGKDNKKLIIILAAVGGGLIVIGGGLVCCCCLFASYGYY